MTATATSPTALDQTPATQRQIDFIITLTKERDTEGTSEASIAASAALAGARSLWRKNGGLNKATASLVIEYLLAAPKKVEEPAAPAPAATGVVEGMHKVGDTIYKVQRAVHGSGHLYAKVLHQDEDGSWHFEYAAGAIMRLSADTLMPLEEAKRFGQLYGVCCVCGRTLTDETSIAEGIGPICGSRFDI